MEFVARWLEGLGLGRYEEAFAAARIGRDVLGELDAADLEKLGVALGDRKRLLRAIAALGRADADSPPPVAPPAVATPAPAVEAERRQVTVTFCDLVGSTALSGRLDPEDLRAVIGRYHACVAATVRRFEGFVAKYMGDGVLVYFGYPHAHEDDAEQAVRAGLALVAAVGALTPPLSRAAGEGDAPLPLPLAGEGWGEGRLQVRIGIATGLVVVGDLIGAGSAQEQAIVGETPNLAARLQALAEPDAILISESTRRQIGARFEITDLGPQSLKGFAEPQRAFRVVAENRTLGRFEALRSGTTPLVGRDEELDLLLRRWAQAKAGSGRVALIAAEPGVGKSRLAEALAERISGEPHIRLRYFCSPHHQDSALHPVIAHMERAAGFAPADAPATKLAKLQALLGYVRQGSTDNTVMPGPRPGHLPAGAPRIAGSSPAMTGLRDPPSSEDVALIAELLALSSAEFGPPLDVTPQRKKEKTFEALLRQIERLSEQQPILMLFEDVHWIDPSSRELLDSTIERVANLAVLLVATFRPEFQPPWTGQPHVTTLALARLDRRDAAAMVTNIAGNHALPSEIVQEIAERTDGVPLFVEELTKAVLESGAQAVATASAPHPALSVPASLHASLMARLDRLGPAAKDVAQTGAVIGREFGYELLALIADRPERELREALDRLTASGLVFARGTPPNSSYTFKHALVQDAAYGAPLRGRRQDLHARIALALEVQFPEVSKSQPELLAHHFTEATLVEHALEYWMKAGQQALARSGMVEAAALLRKALTLLSNLPDNVWRQEHELDLQMAIGQAMAATLGLGVPATGQAFARARQLCDQLNHPHKLLAILWGQLAHHQVCGDLDRAEQLATEMRQLGELRDDVVTRVMGCRTSGMTYLLRGDFAAARAYLVHGLALYNPEQRVRYAELAPQDTLVHMLGTLSLTLVCLGYLDQARSQLDAALTEARRLSHSPTRAHALLWAWLTGWLARSEPKGLLKHASELLDLSAEQGFVFMHALAVLQRGWCLAALGHAEDGIPQLSAGLSDLSVTGNFLGMPGFLTSFADAYRMVGQPQVGLGHLAEAERLAQTTQERWVEAETVRLRGELLMLTRDRGAAESSYREAIALAQRQSARLLELRSATSLARLWRDQGRRAQARELLAPIYGWFTEGFDAPDLIDARALLAELR